MRLIVNISCWLRMHEALLDHNLSPRLVERFADLYPDASHVALAGLERASDNTPDWNTIVT
jgi:hypothetical protein